MPDDDRYVLLMYANPNAAIFPQLAEAYLGYVCVPGGEVVACYDYNRAVEVLADHDEANYDDAADDLDYNYVGCHGPHMPVWLRDSLPPETGPFQVLRFLDITEEQPS